MTSGRVTEVHRTNFIVKVDGREITATVRGNFHAEKDFPKVGDYVSLEILTDEKGVIESVSDRKSVIKRKASDSEEEQIMATNVDLILVVMGLDNDFSVSRLERYLLLAAQSSIPAVIILNKIDVTKDKETQIKEVVEMAGGTPLVAVSATTGENMESLHQYIGLETTAVLLGSSGAGKSTITNWLLEEAVQPVQKIRSSDGRGRHTTTSRQLFELPLGGYLIDTAGMRELGVLESDPEDESEVFYKIEKIAKNCQFRNCDHEKSDGCAVVEAIQSGEISEREINNYHKLQRERAFRESKDSNSSARHELQNRKRQSQKNAAIQRQRLSSGLR